MPTHPESPPPPTEVSATVPPPDTSGSESNQARAKKAMIGAWLGFYVDLFDVYLPTVVLAPAIAYFISPDLGIAGATFATGTIFAATLLGRPLGALVFGRIADTVGRKRAAVLAMSGAAVATLLIALLPGFEQLGVTAVVLFILLRFIGGFFLGGEYTGANPLAMEAAPKEKRGLYSGIINSGFPLAYASVSLITLILLYLLPSQGIDSAYVQWGWRIPFIIGAVMTFALVIYYQKSVTESQVFTSSNSNKSPLKELFAGQNFKNFLQVLVLMMGFWLSLQPIAATLPTLLSDDKYGMSSQSSTLLLVIAYTILGGFVVGGAVLSQRIGRRPFLIASGVAMATVATALYYMLIEFGPGNTTWTVIATLLIVIIVVGPWAVLPAYINERFQTSVRATGYGLAYSLAVVPPSFYAFYQSGLSTFMSFDHAGVVLLFIGALLVAFGGLAGPETKDVDFGEPGQS